MAKIALAMITKGDQGEELERLFSTSAKWFDGMFVTITTKDVNASEAVKKYGGTPILAEDKFHRVIDEEPKWFEDYFGWKPYLEKGDRIFEFDKARNYSFEQVPEEYDWLFWLDTDDILRGGDKIKDLVEIAERDNIDAIFANYLYKIETDDDKIKNVLIEHLRERIIRRGVFKWVAPIHETLIAQRPSKHVDTTDFDVVHLAESSIEGEKSRTMRNVKTLEMLVHDTKGADPRPIYYLGKTLYDLGNFSHAFNAGDQNELFRKAEILFDIYLHGDEKHDFNNKSGWAEERAQCYDYLGEIAKRQNRLNRAVKCAVNAMIEHPGFPTSYLSLAHTYTMMGEWDRSKHWLDIALRIPKPQSTLVGNPKEMASRAHEVVYHWAINTNHIDDAINSAKELMGLHPENPEMKNRFDQASYIKDTIDLTKKYTEVAKWMSLNDPAKIKPLVISAPEIIRDNPFIVNLQKQIFPPRAWEEDEITIYCGPGFTEWTPANLENPAGSFIGGSEEAVIYISQELKKLGWKVTVYAEPGANSGDHDGVMYEPHYKFNNKDEFNILISWRQPAFFDGNYKYKQGYLWMHDIINPLDITTSRLEKVDKIFVLSPWHRANIPDVPDEKVFITGNGITL